MSLAGTLMSPRIDSKIRQNLYKDKKRDYKSILRERFKNRIKENRWTLFDQFRSISNVESSSCIQNTLSSFLQFEILELDVLKSKNNPINSRDGDELNHETFVELMKEIEVELLEEEYNWILEECNFEEERIHSLTTDVVNCPLCHVGVLQQNNMNSLNCTNCNTRIPTSLNLDEFMYSLQQTLQEHSNNCIGNPQFNLVNEGGLDTFCMICDACFSFITY